MANSITTFDKYIAMLDEVYKAGAKTSILDGDQSLVRMGANTGEIMIPKMTLQGLANYGRSSGTGYVQGDVSLTYETVAFNYDRARKFNVEAMDNEETAGIAFGRLAGEFLRTKVTPEVDAFRFAKYAGLAGDVATAGTISTGANVLAALNTASASMDENEVPAEQRILFITPTLYQLAIAENLTTNKAVLSQFSSVIKVPQSRFYTAITLYDGTTSSQENGGFIKNTTTGKDINFMIIHKSAVLQYPKHVVNKIISPEINQTDDAWMFFFREYGLADVYDNKTKGIYLHAKA